MPYVQVDATNPGYDVLGRPLGAQTGDMRCATFNGTDDHVELPTLTPIALTGDYSFACWVRVDDLSAITTVMVYSTASNNRNGMTVETDGSVRAGVFDTGYTGVNSAAGVVTAGQWIHLCYTNSNKTVRLYINGVETTAGTNAPGLAAGGNYHLGSNSGSNNMLNGRMAGAQFFDFVLSPTLIAALYAGTYYGTPYCDLWLNDAAGTVARDHSGNGRSGTLSGSSATAYQTGWWANTQDVFAPESPWYYGYSGVCPMNGKVSNSPAVTLGGTDWFSCADHADFAGITKLTVGGWMKNAAATLPTGQVMLNKYDESGGGEWRIGITGANKLQVVMGDPADGTRECDYTADAAGSTWNTWHHVVFSWDGTSIVLYLDGAAVAGTVTFGSVPTTLYDGTLPVSMGCSFLTYPTIEREWAGSLADWRIYSGSSTVLTAAQVLSWYQGNLETAPSGQTLVRHWPCSENQGDTCYNVSGADGDSGAGFDMELQGGGATTAGTGVRAGRIDSYNRDYIFGHTLDGSGGFIPARTGTALDVNGNALQSTGVRPRGTNLVDRTNGVSAPGTADWETSYDIGDTNTNPLFARDRTSGGTTIEVDRMAAYVAALTGQNLALVEHYTADAAI